jgi:hypothetical protein
VRFSAARRRGTLVEHLLPIFDGTIDGSIIAFKLMTNDGARTISFTGTLQGDAIEFVREVDVVPGGNPAGPGLLGAADRACSQQDASGTSNILSKLNVLPGAVAAHAPMRMNPPCSADQRNCRAHARECRSRTRCACPVIDPTDYRASRGAGRILRAGTGP